MAPPQEEEAPRETRKMVSIVFTDLVGSTAMGERLDPESIRRVMLVYRDRMRAVIDHHGGVIEKFIGDAIMAVFGIPVVNEDDALRAVRTAVGMRDALTALNEELERDWGIKITVRTGVNTGEVLAGATWDVDTGILGDTVNTAARFEQASGAGEILIGPNTYSLVRGAVDVEPMEPLTLKGKAEPVPVYRVIGLKTGAPETQRSVTSPLVGRDRELALLREAFDRAVAERTCHLFTVLGPAGVGKSRLATELLQHAGPTTKSLRGRCLPYGEGITFWPVVEIVKGAAAITDDDSPEQARAKVENLLAGNDEGELIANIISQVIGLGDPTATREEIFWAVRRMFEHFAQSGPLVVIVDDIHWAEATFLDLIEHVANWTRSAPLLLMCMSRPDLLESRPAWSGGKPNASSILLEPLTEKDTEALLDNLLGKAQLSPQSRARILEASGGNPFFVEEMVSMMIDQGLLRRENGDWVPTGDLSSITVPPTIQALLAARLDRLAKEERQVLERASVIGKVFSLRGLRELVSEGFRPQVLEQMRSLERKEFVVPDSSSGPGDDTFRFRHILIRDAAYNSMPKEGRAELHERHANWLVDMLSVRIVEQEEIVGYHFEQAYRHRVDLGMMADKHKQLATQAARHLSNAGQRAAGRGDQPAAVNLMRRSVDLLPAESPDRLPLLPKLGLALTHNGDLEDAEKVFDEALTSAVAAGNWHIEAHARVLRWLLLQQTDDEARAEDTILDVHRSIKVFEDLGDPLGLAQAWHVVAYSYSVLGQSQEAEEALEKSIEYAHQAGDHHIEALSRGALILSMMFGSSPAGDMSGKIEDHLHWARTNGVLITEARALGALGQARAMLGDIEEARAFIAQERRILEELGSKLRVAWSAFEASTVEFLAGDARAADRELTAAYEFLDQMGEKGTLPTLAALLAEAKYEQDLLDDAERLTAVSESNATEDDFLSQIAWRSTRAKILARKGEFEEAERLAREAVAIGARTEFIDAHAKALLDLAETALMAGHHEEASAAVQEAMVLLDRRGNVVAKEHAEKLLASAAVS